MDRNARIRFMIKQTIAGEVFGLQTLEHIKSKILQLKKKPSQALLTELDNQMKDEARHIAAYRRLLSKFCDETKAVSTAHHQWRSLLKPIAQKETPLAAQVALVYGCLEQLNYYILEDQLLPYLNKGELGVVKEIIDDETRHLGMIELFDELLGDQVGSHDQKMALEGVEGFCDFLRTSIELPNQESMQFSKASYRSMTMDIFRLRRRLARWGQLA